MSLGPDRGLRWWFVMLAAAASMMWTAGIASAHASLVSTSPGNGTHVDQSPTELVLQLNEPVTLIEGSAQLIDSEGTRAEFSDVRLDDGQRRIVLVPAGSLADGAYLATARVVSADTHVVSLSIQFAVGSVTQQGKFANNAAASGVEQYLNYPSKAITYLGLVLSAGLYVAARWVWPTALRDPRFRVISRIGIGLLLTGLIARFAVLVAQQSGGISNVSAEAARTLVLTPLGLAILSAVVVSVIELLILARADRLSAIIGVPQAAAAILAVTLGGHGGSVQGWPWSFLGTLVHVYGITVWLGGVAMIVLVLRGAPELRRWHVVAAAHVALAVFGGLVLSILQVRPLAALVSTTYGLVLVAKVIGAVAVIALGYLTYRWFRHTGAAAGRPRTLALEAGLAVVVLAVTAVLTTLTPAKDAYTTTIATTLDFGASEIVHVGIDSIRRGPQQLTVDYALGDNAAAEGELPTVSVDLSSESANVARLPVTLAAAVEENGSLIWRSDRLIVPAPGRWKVTVRFDGRHGPKLASFYYEAL